jgi:hypothetical protein
VNAASPDIAARSPPEVGTTHENKGATFKLLLFRNGLVYKTLSSLRRERSNLIELI